MSGTRNQGLLVAIDGPAGAGKSSATIRLTAELSYQLLDTGALYRALALVAQKQGVSWSEEVNLGALAENLSVHFDLRGDTNHVVVDGEDVTAAIRTPEISEGASIVSALPAVRAGLLQLQRRLGSWGGVVAEGRDMGTVVFPNADVKFFLTASIEVRAQRRHQELAAKGIQVSLAETLAEITTRDDRDSNRGVAPLSMAADAILVDSTDQGLDQVVHTMMGHIRRVEMAAQR